MQIFTEEPFEIAIQSMIDECVQDAIKERPGVRLEFICDKSSSAPRSVTMLKVLDFRDLPVLNIWRLHIWKALLTTVNGREAARSC